MLPGVVTHLMRDAAEELRAEQGVQDYLDISAEGPIEAEGGVAMPG